MNFKLLLFVLSTLMISACAGSDESKPSKDKRMISGEQLPAHLQDLENLIILPDLEPSGKVLFTKAQEYGEIFPKLLPPQLGFGPEEAVDENGYVYRAEKGERTVLVFNDDGDLIKKVGREGRGPGEFQSVVAVNITEDQLVVFDSILSRISIFSTNNFELLKTLTIDANLWGDQVEAKYLRPQTIVALGNGLYLTSVIEEKEEGSMHQAYYKMDGEGKIVSGKIIETKNSEGHTGTTKQGHSAGIKPPYSTLGKISVSKEGLIFHINTEEFLITKYDRDGNYVGSLYYPFEKDPLEEKEVLDEYHPNMHPVFDNAEFPDTWPALESLIIDDENRIWVSTIVADKEIRQWYMLEDSGEVLATFSWPRDSEIKIVRNNKIYAEETDPETEAKVIVGYDVDYSE